MIEGKKGCRKWKRKGMVIALNMNMPRISFEEHGFPKTAWKAGNGMEKISGIDSYKLPYGKDSARERAARRCFYG